MAQVMAMRRRRDPQRPSSTPEISRLIVASGCPVRLVTSGGGDMSKVEINHQELKHFIRELRKLNGNLDNGWRALRSA